MSHRLVALLIETSNAYARNLLRGIIRYVREQHRPWSIRLLEQGRGDTPPAWLKHWEGDGIIARIENRKIADAVTMTKLPVIDVSAARLLPELPWVETDDAAISRLAFDHLFDRNFRSFAFCGDSRFNWSNWRRDHFIQLVESRGFQCAVHDFRSRATGKTSEELQRRKLHEWLISLPKPVGLLACYDVLGHQILDVCHDQQLRVPDDIAVLGVDNDELLCSLTIPPLSSVIPDGWGTGYEAARLLDRQMTSRKHTAERILMKPLGVFTRQSTDVLAIDDPDVAAAIRLIRARALEGINVQDVLKEIPLSRRALEIRFRELLNRTPHDEIMRVRIERVKELLLTTDLGLSEIAARTGFRHVEYLSVAFRRHEGQPPGEFRRGRSRVV
jgi:LacI family transcriptional regulator